MNFMHCRIVLCISYVQSYPSHSFHVALASAFCFPGPGEQTTCITVRMKSVGKGPGSSTND